MRKIYKKLLSAFMVFILLGGVFCNINRIKAAEEPLTLEKTIMVYDKDQYAGQIYVYVGYHYEGSRVIMDSWYAAHLPNSSSYFIQDVLINPFYDDGQATVVIYYKLYSHGAFIKEATYSIPVK